MKKIYKKTYVRTTAIIWVFLMVLLMLVWWFICIFEYLTKLTIDKPKFKIRFLYFAILKDGYETIIQSVKNAIEEIKSGQMGWM